MIDGFPMTETIQHRDLVGCMAEWVRQRYVSLYSFSVLVDVPTQPGSPRVDMIGGYRPDLLAQDSPVTTRVIGEAKTRRGLRSARAVAQARAFVGYLGLVQCQGLFVLCVPRSATAEARSLARKLLLETHYAVPVCVLDDVGRATIHSEASWR